MNDQIESLRVLLHSVDGIDPEVPSELVAKARKRRATSLAGRALVLALAVATVGGGAALLVERRATDGLPLAVPSPSHNSSPASTPSTAQARPVVPPGEIARRCALQMKAYSGLRNYQPTRPWSVLQPFEHREGDVVAMKSGMNNPAYCLLPARGDEATAIDLEIFAPSLANRGRLLELCSEGNSRRQRSTTGEGRMVPAEIDLRNGTILHASQDRTGPIQVLIRSGRDTFACTAFAPTWDVGGTEVFQVDSANAVMLSVATTGASNKSIVPEEASYYFGSGRLAQKGGRLEMLDGDTLLRQVPVDADGYWNVMLRVPGPGGVKDLTWRVADASGKVTRTGRVLG